MLGPNAERLGGQGKLAPVNSSKPASLLGCFLAAQGNLINDVFIMSDAFFFPHSLAALLNKA